MILDEMQQDIMNFVYDADMKKVCVDFDGIVEKIPQFGELPRVMAEFDTFSDELQLDFLEAAMEIGPTLMKSNTNLINFSKELFNESLQDLSVIPGKEENVDKMRKILVGSLPFSIMKLALKPMVMMQNSCAPEDKWEVETFKNKMPEFIAYLVMQTDAIIDRELVDDKQMAQRANAISGKIYNNALGELESLYQQYNPDFSKLRDALAKVHKEPSVTPPIIVNKDLGIDLN